MRSYGKAGIHKDSWQHWQDEQLAQVVKEYESKGKTQQEAFELASAMVGKTAASCSNRWHTELKDKHWTYEPRKSVAVNPSATECSNEIETKVVEPDIEYNLEKIDGMYKIAIFANDCPTNRPIIKRFMDIIRELTG